MTGKRTRMCLAALSLCLLASVPPRAAAAGFRDVPAGYWAEDAITLCVEQGFFTGQDGDTFGVGVPMERGAFMAVLCRFFGWEEDAAGKHPYSDVDSAMWFSGAVAAAYAHGAVTRQTSTFRPYEAITREELAVTLVRALGYQSLAGLTEPVPFSDVTKNIGYIAMAYDLGLMNGNQGQFMPEKAATREQTAAVLARLYQNLHSSPLERIGLISSPADLSRHTRLTAAAIRTGRLTGANPNSVRLSLDWEKADNMAATVRGMGITPLLYISGSALTRDVPALLASRVRSSSQFGGLFLHLSSRPDPSYVRDLKERLGDVPLYLAVSIAPADRYNGDREADLRNCEQLLPWVDRLILCVEGSSRIVNAFPQAPVEPLEEVYAVVRTLKEAGGLEKTAVLMTTTGNVWTDTRQTGSASEQEIDTLLEEYSETVHTYYAERYACAYLHLPAGNTGQEQVIWYLNPKAVAERTRFLRLLGVRSLCLSDVGGMTEAVWEALG